MSVLHHSPRVEFNGGAESTDSAAWERVARLLTARRVQLNPEYRNRQRFLADTGLNERMVADLERARRTSYRVTTIQAIEQAYQLAPGSIQEVLQNPDLTEFPRRSVSATVQLGGPIRAEASISSPDDRPDPFKDPGDLPSWVELRALPKEEAQVLSALTELTVDERLKVSIVVRQMVAKRPHRNGDAHPRTGRHGQDAG